MDFSSLVLATAIGGGWLRQTFLVNSYMDLRQTMFMAKANSAGPLGMHTFSEDNPLWRPFVVDGVPGFAPLYVAAHIGIDSYIRSLPADDRDWAYGVLAVGYFLIVQSNARQTQLGGGVAVFSVRF